MIVRGLISLLLFTNLAQADVGISLDCVNNETEIVPLIMCVDDEFKELDQLKLRIQTRIFARIQVKYAKRDPERAKLLKAKIDSSIEIWEQYRASYCDMESIHMEGDNSRGEFVKQCLVSITKTRIEDLRLLQINL